MRISDWSSDVCSSDLLIGCLADEFTERDFDLVLSRVIPSRDDWLMKIVDANRVDGLIIIGQSDQSQVLDQIGRESCRERVCQYVSISVVGVTLKTKMTQLAQTNSQYQSKKKNR